MARFARFDHAWNELLVSAQSLKGSAAHVESSIRTYRRAAFRFVAALIECQENFHNDLVAQCERMKTTVKDWIDDHFAMIADIGDTPQSIMHAIKHGTTESDYVNGGAKVATRNYYNSGKEEELAAEAEKAAVEIEASPTISDAEKIRLLTELTSSLRKQLNEVTKQLRMTIRERDSMAREVRPIIRAVERSPFKQVRALKSAV